MRAANAEPPRHRIARGDAYRHDPLLAALAQHAHFAGCKIASGDVELRELGKSQPR